MLTIRKVKRPLDYWYQTKGVVLFTWSILNPNGPTVSCVGLRATGVDAEIEIFYRWMHFLGGETYVLGLLDGSASEDEFDAGLKHILESSFAENIGPIFDKFPLVSAVPSFVTSPNAPLTANDVFELITESPEFKSADWGAQTYYLQKFGSNFFDRAAEETRNAIESFKAKEINVTEDAKKYAEFVEIQRGALPGFKNWKPNQFQSRSFEINDAQNWWIQIYKDEFIDSALSQLGSAWVGSIYQYQAGDSGKKPVESFEDIKNFMSHMKHDLWPDSWSTLLLLQNMNLK
jgi:hypothetical protein